MPGWIPNLQRRTLPLCLLTICLTVSAFAQKPQQVIVSVKIIEFQASKDVETGLSAYFRKVSQPGPFGEVTTSGSSINSADITFPTSTAAGITVFLDRISLNQGEIEVVLQALVDENRAFILSKPHAMVKVGAPVETIVETVQEIPYENTVVVGSTAVQVTKFENTGVMLKLKVPDVIDDDGNWNTRDDTYVNLQVEATVKEEGQRIVVALDDALAAGGEFSLARNAISVPEFISRRIKTEVWVRDGQVLMLGGLYRNTESKNISTLPWLTQAEEAGVGFIENIFSGTLPANPISTVIGNRDSSDSRRELVFLIKSEIWRPSLTIPDDLGFIRQQPHEEQPAPTDVVTEIPEAPAAAPQENTGDQP